MIQSSLEGVGLGLRFDHFPDILANPPKTPWFEVIVEDFLSPGPQHAHLLTLRENKPIAFHSIGLNLGGISRFDIGLLGKYKDLYDKYQPKLITDHLCWSEHGGRFHHDLLPIVKTKEALKNVCERVSYLQDFFQRELCLENITSYIDYKDEDFGEIEFIEAMTQKTGCKLLLDISNVLINHNNRKLDPKDYFAQFPLHAVKQVHISGGSFDSDTGWMIDSHSDKVALDDIEILKALREKGLDAPVLVERDAEVPPFKDLEEERLEIERRVYGI